MCERGNRRPPLLQLPLCRWQSVRGSRSEGWCASRATRTSGRRMQRRGSAQPPLLSLSHSHRRAPAFIQNTRTRWLLSLPLPLFQSLPRLATRTGMTQQRQRQRQRWHGSPRAGTGEREARGRRVEELGFEVRYRECVHMRRQRISLSPVRSPRTCLRLLRSALPFARRKHGRRSEMRCVHACERGSRLHDDSSLLVLSLSLSA